MYFSVILSHLKNIVLEWNTLYLNFSAELQSLFFPVLKVSSSLNRGLDHPTAIDPKPPLLVPNLIRPFA